MNQYRNSHRFNVSDYYRMGETGVLPMDDPSVELIDGEIVDVAPLSPWHAAVNSILLELFVLSDRDEQTVVSIRGPIRLDEWNEAVPDVLILKNRRSYYGEGHPGSEAALLLVEVADSALPFVREVKVPTYARFGVGEVWVVDLKAESITIHRDPADGAYRSVRTARRGESVSVAAIPGLSIGVNRVLGRGRGTLYE
jgi:Uma2 family endonuclease